MNIDQITDIAYEVVSELEPAQSFDVFDVSDSHIILQDQQRIITIRFACLNIRNSLRDEIKNKLSASQKED